MPHRPVFFFVLVVCCLSTSMAAQFEWATPQPHRQEWTDMAVGNGCFVGTTEGYGGRSVYTSKDGVVWTQPASAPRGIIKELIFDDGRFFAVGLGDSVYTSTNGVDWSAHPVGAGFQLFSSVAVGNGVTVVTGYGGVGFVSRDLVSWTRVTPFRIDTVPQVAFGNGRFVAITPTSTPGPTPPLTLTSVDGLVWTEGGRVNLPDWIVTPFTYSNLIFSNGLFAMNAGNGEQFGIHTSPDGVTWTVTELRSRRLYPTEGGFIGVDDEVAKSADGRNWQFLFTYPRADQLYLTCAAEFDGTVVAAGTRGMLFVRRPREEWRRLVNPVDYTRWKVVYGNGEFLRFGESGMQASVDGTVWRPIAPAPILLNAAFGNGVWVGVNSDLHFSVSTDGRSWTTVQPPVQVREVHFANGMFVAETSNDFEAIAVSRDGRNWRRIDFRNLGVVNIFGYANGRWGGMAGGLRPVTSEDGENWTVHPGQAGFAATFFAAGNDRFLGLRSGGMGPIEAVWSFDGVRWHKGALGSLSMVIPISLTFGGGNFLLTDYVGRVLTSADGFNWSGFRESPTPFDSAAYGGGRWLVAGGETILRSIVRAGPARPALVFAHTSPTTMTVTLNGEVGLSYDIQTAPAVTGPWSVLRRVQTAEGGRGAIEIDVSGGGAFLRAINAP